MDLSKKKEKWKKIRKNRKERKKERKRDNLAEISIIRSSDLHMNLAHICTIAYKVGPSKLGRRSTVISKAISNCDERCHTVMMYPWMFNVIYNIRSTIDYPWMFNVIYNIRSTI